jgi:hypothetical protein
MSRVLYDEQVEVPLLQTACPNVKEATEQAPVCLNQMDAELHLCAVMAEKNAMRFQTSYGPRSPITCLPGDRT